MEGYLKKYIVGTEVIYESALKHGVSRVVFASSTHLYGAYEGYPVSSPLGRPIRETDVPRPDSYYGTSKGFGEILARQYYDLNGISTVAIRIGSVAPDNNPVPPYQNLWLSHKDTVQIFEKAIEADVDFGIYFATSEIPTPIFDITSAKNDLGYLPVDKLS